MAAYALRVKQISGATLHMNLDRYIEVNWVAGGREYPDLDCYGLVLDVRENLGLEPWPEFDGVLRENEGLDKTAKVFTATLERCEPEPGAVVLVYRAGIVDHVAVVVQDGPQLGVIECNPNVNVVLSPLARFKRKHPKLEFWK